MKKILYNTFSVLMLLTTLLITSCNEDPTASLEGYPSANLPAPLLSTVSPSDQALAGVTTITITGSNFSTEARNNLVYFNGVPGTTLNATPTQLTVKVPNVVSDTVLVKIAVVGAKDFSNAYQFKMLSAWEVYYPFENTDKAYGIILDNNNNLLVSVLGKGIWKITPPPFDSTSKSVYVPIGTYTGKWDNFRYGPGGELYGARTARGVWKIVEGVAPGSPWASPTTGSIIALEFDNNQNLWALNASNSIFKIRQDASVTSYPFNGVLRAVRIFENNLYVAATKAGVEGVWKIPITQSGDLGTEELYFDVTNIRLQTKINAIAFAADGDMIIGLDKGPNPLLVVKSNGSYEELYPGVVAANSVISMYWPVNGTSLYIVRGEEKDDTGKVTVGQAPLRIEMEKIGAPYFGQ